jgi:hypothetical protein
MKTGSTVLHPEKPQPIPIPPETATLVILSETSPGLRSRTYGNYLIPAKKSGERYAKLVIRAARCVIDLGNNQKQYFIVKADEIACDLARECNNDIWGIGSSVTGELTSDTNEASEVVRGFSGVFVCEATGHSGSGIIGEPTEEELEKAEDLLRQSDKVLVERGHSEWDQFHRPDMIHDGFKRSARRLGVDAEWLYKVTSGLPDCPHCGSKLKSPKATVCATCHRDIVPENGTERHETEDSATSKAKGKGRQKAA